MPLWLYLMIVSISRSKKCNIINYKHLVRIFLI